MNTTTNATMTAQAIKLRTLLPRPEVEGFIFLRNSEVIPPGDTRIPLRLVAWAYGSDGSRLEVYQGKSWEDLILFHLLREVDRCSPRELSAGGLICRFDKERIPARFAGCSCHVPAARHVSCPARATR